MTDAKRAMFRQGYKRESAEVTSVMCLDAPQPFSLFLG